MHAEGCMYGKRLKVKSLETPRKISWCSRPGLQHYYIHRPLLDHCSVSCEGSLGQAGTISVGDYVMKEA
jgi:hypothetical protein